MPRKKATPSISKSRTRGKKKAIVKTTLCYKDGDLGKLVNQMRSLMRTAGIDKLSLWSSTTDVTMMGVR